MKYETLHWCAFNIMIRLFGFITLLAALAFLYAAFVQFTGTAVSASNINAPGNLLVSAFLLIGGIAFLTVAPYRPDLRLEKIDCTNATKSEAGWWTGNPKKI